MVRKNETYVAESTQLVSAMTVKSFRNWASCETALQVERGASAPPYNTSEKIKLSFGLVSFVCNDQISKGDGDTVYSLLCEVALLLTSRL